MAKLYSINLVEILNLIMVNTVVKIIIKKYLIINEFKLDII